MQITQFDRVRSALLASALAVAALVLLAAPGGVLAENLETVSDFHGTASASPGAVVEAGGVRYFAAGDGLTGTELWRTDGTEAGTKEVADIRPGAAGSSPQQLTEFKGALYFTANDGGGIELWRSDGTEQGTVPVDEAEPPIAVTGLRVSGPTLYFRGSGPHGAELWRTDGTEAGTEEVADINPGPGSSNVTGITDVDGNGTVYFGASRPAGGTELWRSDGTGDGTKPVADVNPTGSSNPTNVYHPAGPPQLAYFTASDGSTGTELWRTEGDEATTVPVADIEPGPGSSSPSSLTAIGGTLYFAASRAGEGTELWRSEGDEATTVPVADIEPGPGSSSPSSLTAIGGTLYFAASRAGEGSELWCSKGDKATTVPVADIEPGATGSTPAGLTAVGSDLFFVASTSSDGRELWQSDGSAPGTSEVADILPRFGSSQPANLTAVAGDLYFSANDGIAGAEPWRTDGTPAGTTRVADVNQVRTGGGQPANLTITGNYMFTGGDTASGNELRTLDFGEEESLKTVLVKDIDPGPVGSGPADLRAFRTEGTVYFNANDGVHGRELWVTEGNEASTRLVADIAGGRRSSTPSGFALLDHVVYFAADDGGAGVELWRTDGTEEGTELVADIDEGPASSRPESLVTIGERVFFTADDGVHGRELWKVEGGVASLVADIREGPESSGAAWLPNAEEFGGRLLFSADDGSDGRELWVSDGSTGGTRQLADINEGGGDSFPVGFVDFHGQAFFKADDGETGDELWRTDGTEEGTQLVKDINEGAAGSAIVARSIARGRLFFNADDGVHGSELWSTDGTPGGTQLVEDIAEGAASGVGATMTTANTTLYMAANDGAAHGEEFWRSDGTAAGTYLVADLRPGGISSGPSQIVTGGSDMVFVADEGAGPQVHYYEPPAIPGAGTLSVDQLTTTGVRLRGAAETAGGGPITTCRFEYGTTTAYGLEAPCEPPPPYSEETIVSATIEELEPGTTYHFRVVVANAEGPAEGEDGVFSTHGLPPLVSVQSATDIGEESATLHGEVDPAGFGDAENCWFVYWTTTREEPSVRECQPHGQYSAPTSVSATIEELEPGTTYHLLVEALNDWGQTESDVETFTTLGTAIPDADHDGILDAVDTLPEAFSTEFDDGQGTTGAIFEWAGLDPLIGDAAAPDGVFVRTGPGAGEAKIGLCGSFTVAVAPESEMVLTCGSLSLTVLEGAARIVLGGGEEISIAVPAGGAARATLNKGGTVKVENLGPVAVTVSVEGVGTPLAPGKSRTIADLFEPETTIVSGPGSLTNDSTPTFHLGSSDSGSTFECSLDSAPFAACTASYTPAPLVDGPHSVEVKATDKAGHTDSTPASSAFTVDTSVPETTIDSEPGALTTNPTPTFTFYSDDPTAVFECKLDSFAYLPCSSPVTTIFLVDGSHTGRVRAVDAAGNVDKTPAVSTFTVDTAAPETTVEGPSGAIDDATPKLHFTSTEPGATFQCRIDSDPFGPCSGPGATHTPPVALADGPHTFEVTSTDKVGNTDPTPASASFTVDTLAPETTIDSAPPAFTANASPSVPFSSDDPTASFECKLDAGPYEGCGSPRDLGALAEGKHTFRVRAIDVAGNVDKTPAAATFTVDTSVPETTIETGPSGPTKDATPKFHFTSTEASVSFECRIDGGPFAACSGPGANHTPATALADGPHSFEVRAVDKAGNVDPSPATRSFSVDTHVPETTIDSAPSGTISNASPTIAFSSDEPTATFECKLDADPYFLCTSPSQFGPLANGAHTLKVRALDAAGNVDASPAQAKFTVKK